jgi:hypothetical protein
MISGIQFYESVVPNIMQNRGNYAIVKQVPLQPSPLWGENVGKIYSTWIFGNRHNYPDKRFALVIENAGNGPAIKDSIRGPSAASRAWGISYHSD